MTTAMKGSPRAFFEKKGWARERYDPTEDWMPTVSALDLSRRAYFEAHPEEAPAHCPVPACGYRGYGPGQPCPRSDTMITTKYGQGLHAVRFLVADGGDR